MNDSASNMSKAERAQAKREHRVTTKALQRIVQERKGTKALNTDNPGHMEGDILRRARVARRAEGGARGPGNGTNSPIDLLMYNRMTDLYRVYPKNYAEVANRCGVHYNTARRAWLHGWPYRKLEAIGPLVENEIAMARAQREREDATKAAADAILETTAARTEADRLRAQEDAIATRSQEGQMVKAARGNVLAIQGVMGRVLRGILTRAQDIEDKVKDASTPPAEVLRLAVMTGKLVKNATESARICIEMERVMMGEPASYIGLLQVDMPQDEALRVLELAARTHARLARADLTVETTGESVRDAAE